MDFEFVNSKIFSTIHYSLFIVNSTLLVVTPTSSLSVRLPFTSVYPPYRIPPPHLYTCVRLPFTCVFLPFGVGTPTSIGWLAKLIWWGFLPLYLSWLVPLRWVLGLWCVGIVCILLRIALCKAGTQGIVHLFCTANPCCRSCTKQSVGRQCTNVGFATCQHLGVF